MLADEQEHISSACSCFAVKKLTVLKSQHKGIYMECLCSLPSSSEGGELSQRALLNLDFFLIKLQYMNETKHGNILRNNTWNFFSHRDGISQEFSLWHFPIHFPSAWCIEEEELRGTKSFALLPSPAAQTLQEWGLCSSQCGFSPHSLFPVLPSGQFLCRF